MIRILVGAARRLGARFRGAAVVLVDDAVVVAVRRGQAALRQEALVVGALVVRIHDAVAIRVLHRAAVGIHAAVLALAGVVDVLHAVVVVIQLGALLGRVLASGHAAGRSVPVGQAQQRAETRYAFGDEPTLADVCLVPQMANARRFNTDLSPFPRLVAWDEAARKHPAFIKAAPENQKDTPKK